MRAVIDRIENDRAVILIGSREEEQIELPVDYLPQKAEEGSILNIELTVDEKSTEETEKRVRNLLDNLKEKDQ